jgi:hypothetical protein
MFGRDRIARISVAAAAAAVLSVKIAAPQDVPALAAPFSRSGDSDQEHTLPSTRPRRITLEQVKQQSANRAASPLAYMSHLSVEAAKQHRLGVQADYC